MHGVREPDAESVVGEEVDRVTQLNVLYIPSAVALGMRSVHGLWDNWLII
jgi:hypothetical protein